MRVKLYLARVDDRAIGRAEVWDGPDQVVERSVDGATCHEVGDALALIVALAFDRALKPSEIPRDGGAAEGPVDAEPDAAASSLPLAPVADLPLAPVADDSSGVGGPSPWWSVGAQAHALGGLAPWVSYGGSLSLERASHRWVLRLSANYVPQTAGSLTETRGTAWFSLLSARIDACPVRWQFASGLEIDPCVVLGIGRVEAAGTPLGTIKPEETKSDALWADLGALARVSWRMYGPFWAEAEGELQLLLAPREYDFVVDRVQNLVAYRPPHVTGRGGVGLSYHFP